MSYLAEFPMTCWRKLGKINPSATTIVKITCRKTTNTRNLKNISQTYCLC
jgi:hypothetical protein